MSQIRVTFELPSGEQKTKKCDKDTTIERISQALTRNGILCDGITYEGHRLTGKRTLSEIQYTPGTVMKVVSTTVTVLIGDRNMSTHMSRKSTIEELATQVRGAVPDFRWFTYNGRSVRPSNTLADIKYEEGTPLVVVQTGAEPETPRRKNKDDPSETRARRGKPPGGDDTGDQVDTEAVLVKGGVQPVIAKGARRPARKDDDLAFEATKSHRAGDSKALGTAALTQTLPRTRPVQDTPTKITIKVKNPLKEELFSVKNVPLTSKVEVVFEQLKSKYPDLLSLVYCGRVIDTSVTLQDLGYQGETYFLMYLAGPPQLQLVPPPEDIDPENDYVERLRSEIPEKQLSDFQNIKFPDGFDDVMKIVFWRECNSDALQTSAKLESL